MRETLAAMAKILTMKALLYLFLATSILACVKKQSVTLQEIKQPIGWKNLTSENIISNVKRIHDINDTTTLLNQFKTSKLLYSYAKYPDRSFKSIIPSIKIEIRKNKFASDDDFFTDAKTETDDWQKYFDSLKFLEGPKIIDFKGVKALYMNLTYSKKLNDTIWHPRSKTFLVPSGNIIYQIHFNDERSIDCQDEFSKIIDNIKFE